LVYHPLSPNSTKLNFMLMIILRWDERNIRRTIVLNLDVTVDINKSQLSVLKRTGTCSRYNRVTTRLAVAIGEGADVSNM
jgi:hypothetical protein